jgi:hypothetical protein
MTSVRIGEPEATSKDVPIELLCRTLMAVVSEGLTVAVTPSLITMPAPILPVDAIVSLEIPGDMSRTEGGDGRRLHGLVHECSKR